MAAFLDIQKGLSEEIGSGQSVIRVGTLLRRLGHQGRPTASAGARAVQQLIRWGFAVTHEDGTGPSAKLTILKPRIERIPTRYHQKLVGSRRGIATISRLQPDHEYRVLSIHGPWAWSIIYAGKDIENRTWGTAYTGPILIHASSRRYTGDTLEEARRYIAKCSKMPLEKVPMEFPTSAILGSVDVVDCTDLEVRSPWAEPDAVKWILRDPQALTSPVQNIDGKLNLWKWTAPKEP